MAPFSVCSKCNVKTRKVVKDPIILKMIYLCPLCFKNRNTQQNKSLAKDEIITKQESENIIEVSYKKTEAERLDWKKQTKMEVQASKENKSRSHIFKPPLPPLQRMSKLITPPVMQTVIINGRKYVAISETADD